MKSLKAIAVGSVIIIAVILSMQLAYIFIAVGYNALAKYYPVLKDIAAVFRYIIGIPAVMAGVLNAGYYSHRAPA
jgi:hypothetical protein